MPHPSEHRDWLGPDGFSYRIWLRRHEKYVPGVVLSFVQSADRQRSVMYRGPDSLPQMSERVLGMCLKTASQRGFVWFDPDSGEIWQVRIPVTFVSSRGQCLEAHLPRLHGSVWRLPDRELRRLLREAQQRDDRSRAVEGA